MMKKSLALWLTTVSVGALALAGCSDPTKGPANNDSSTIIVGSADFPESEIVGNLYAEVLEKEGVKVQTRFRIGSREAYIPALQDGSINLIPDYTGNLLAFLDKDTTATAADDINKALPDQLDAKGLKILEPAPAEDKDSMVVTSETAQKWNLSEIGDLASHGAEVSLGAPPEFKERSVGLPGLEKHYGFKPKSFVPISDGGGPATVKALKDGKIQVANIFSTSPDIPANNFVVLKDPKNNFPAQNVVPVINKDVAEKLGEDATKALNKVSAALTTEELIKLNDEVSGSKKVEPKEAARQWLQEKGLI